MEAKQAFLYRFDFAIGRTPRNNDRFQMHRRGEVPILRELIVRTRSFPVIPGFYLENAYNMLTTWLRSTLPSQ